MIELTPEQLEVLKMCATDGPYWAWDNKVHVFTLKRVDPQVVEQLIELDLLDWRGRENGMRTQWTEIELSELGKEVVDVH